jgi:hypothetical protein
MRPVHSLIIVGAFLALACGNGEPIADTTASQASEATVTSIEAPLYADLKATIEAARGEFDRIPEERRQRLREISRFVEQRVSAGAPARLTFICTHNSRRSHMSQIWAQTAAHAYGVPNVETFSGGTEATAFNPRAVAAIERAGFRVDRTRESDNPVYHVRFDDGSPPMEAFSKVYDKAPNPTEDFAAVMTCSQADKNCPLVLGSAARIAIPYDDPKAFDGTDQEAAKYDERCRDIAREMLFVFAQVKTQPT